MPVHDVLMGLGELSVTLKATAPTALRERIVPGGHIVVTPAPVARVDPSMARATLFGLSRFSSIVMRRENQMRTFTGPSVLAWLGDADGKGDYNHGGYPPGDNWEDAVTAVWGGLGDNGISLGTFHTPETVVMQESLGGIANATPPESIRDWLDRVRIAVGMEFRVTPAGVFDSGSIGSALFRTDPVVVITRDGDGLDIPYYALRATDLDAVYSIEDFASHSWVSNSTGLLDYATSGHTYPQNFTGSASAVMASNTQVDHSDAFAAGIHAAVEAATNFVPRTEISVKCAMNNDPGGLMVPGDYVYVYDVECGLVDTANEIQSLGRMLHPVKTRLLGLRYSIVEGMGVAYISGDGNNTIIDLSEFVEFETGDMELEVGTIYARKGLKKVTRRRGYPEKWAYY